MIKGARTCSRVTDWARKYAAGGLSVIAITADGTKSPRGPWKGFQKCIIDDADIDQHFKGKCGIGVVGGIVSGNLEILDIDEPELVEPFEAAVRELSPGLLEDLPTVATPRNNHGGRHYYYGLDGAPAGNTKLALSEPRLQWNDDGTPQIDPRTGAQKFEPDTMIETRGEGGYVLAPGSPGACHPTGLQYKLLSQSSIEKTLLISPDDHAILWRVARSLNRYVQEGTIKTTSTPRAGRNGQSPGDAYEQSATWDEILTPFGWAREYTAGGITHWRRPGKSKGTSATTGCTSKSGRDLLCVFTSNAPPLEGPNPPSPCTSYGKFAAYTVLNHNGDYSAAAKALASDGNHDRDPAIVTVKTSIHDPIEITPGDFVGKRDVQSQIGRAVVTRLSEVQPMPIKWSWWKRIPVGKLTGFCGMPDVGKSVITLDIASRKSRGIPWPDDLEHPNERGGTVLLSAEDDLSDTVVPRLIAAGADLSHVISLKAVRWLDPDGNSSERQFSLEHDLAALEDAIDQCPNCQQVIIDPVDSYLGAVDSHRNAAVRGVLAPLAELAARRQVALIVVMHLNKTKGGPAMYRSSGSVGFIAACRAAWLFAKDPDDPSRRLMLPIKGNLTADVDGLAYQIRADGEYPHIEWESEPVNMTADDVVARQDEPKRSKVRNAADWLATLLRDGRVATEEIQAKAKNAGLSWASVRRAKEQLEVEDGRDGFGRGSKCYWSMGDHTRSTSPRD